MLLKKNNKLHDLFRMFQQICNMDGDWSKVYDLIDDSNQPVINLNIHSDLPGYKQLVVVLEHCKACAEYTMK